MGETDTHYHFYCIYRRSQDKAVEVFAPKNGILTDFLMEDYHDVEFDPTPYEGKSGFKLYEHQIDTIKFLLSRKKGIVSLDMGMGKTISAIVAALEGKYEHILVISPSSVKKTWENELMHFVDEDEFTVVQGSKWDDAKFTIINYDILDNFYTIPEQTVKSSELNVDDDGNVIREYKNKKIVATPKDMILDTDPALCSARLQNTKRSEHHPIIWKTMPIERK